jgi:hypothetical protein
LISAGGAIEIEFAFTDWGYQMLSLKIPVKKSLLQTALPAQNHSPFGISEKLRSKKLAGFRNNLCLGLNDPLSWLKRCVIKA